MKQRFRPIAAIAAVAALLLAGSCTAGPLRIVGENLPPSSMMDGDVVVGRETAKVRELLARAGVSYQIALLPWKRAFAQAQNEVDTCIYAATRTPEREKLFRWIGPLNEGQWVLYALASRNLAFQHLDEVRGLTIGTLLGDARDDYLRQRGFDVAPVTQEWLNPQKLLMGRIDLWAVGVANGTRPFAGKPWEDKLAPVLVFNRVQTYLACNKAVPEVQLQAMERAVAAMRRDGSMARHDLAGSSGFPP